MFITNLEINTLCCRTNSKVAHNVWRYKDNSGDIIEYKLIQREKDVGVLSTTLWLTVGKPGK